MKLECFKLKKLIELDIWEKNLILRIMPTQKYVFWDFEKKKKSINMEIFCI